MITTIGNNFGADQFQIKDFQNEKTVVLNGKFSFNNKSEAFKAASVLEIYVPELSIPKSGMSGAYIMFESEGKFYGTTVKTWLKNQNTICIEKLDHWSDPGTHRPQVHSHVTPLFLCPPVGTQVGSV